MEQHNSIYENNSILKNYNTYLSISASYEALLPKLNIPHPSLLITKALKKLYQEMSEKTIIMGILNVTPDSFSDGGENSCIDFAYNNAIKMISDGADILDIGGESTRPGSEPISAEEELDRIIPIISAISKETNAVISVDTYKAEVAEKALEAGASIINDITGAKFDSNMPYVIANGRCPAVIMHINGTPHNMQINPVAKDIILKIIQSLSESVQLLLKAGVKKELIIVDPGIGFGKTTEQNLHILKNLRAFKSLEAPILIGTSRKSTIGNILKIDDPKDRIEGTSATTAVSIMNGANIIRVHDVKEISRVAKMTDAILHS